MKKEYYPLENVDTHRVPSFSPMCKGIDDHIGVA